MEWEQGYRKSVASSLHSLTASDFVCGVGTRRKERLHAIFGTVLFGRVAQHQQPAFMILILPRLQKTIGCG